MAFRATEVPLGGPFSLTIAGTRLGIFVVSNLPPFFGGPQKENAQPMKPTLLFTGILAALVLGGCTPEAREKYDQAGDSVGAAAQKTADAASTDAKETGKAVEKAGAVAEKAAKDTAENVADATMTPKVKQALLGASGLETKDINVETANNTITLKGSVPNAKQKEQAGTIAKGIAGTQYKVDNQLTVSGATGATDAAK